jgi:16S rRNA U516 pseudouridylate synthase RsuA-like enzyme
MAALRACDSPVVLVGSVRLAPRNWDNVKAQVESKRPLKTLERVLSKAGLGSRVDARSWIHAGRVQVNGKVLRNPDHWVDIQRDRVRFDDKPLVVRERMYLLLYKPSGYLTTYKDPEGRRCTT